MPQIHEKKWKLSISMKVGLSDKARQMPSKEIHKSCPIMVLSALYYIKPQIHEKSDNYQVQWK